MDYSKIKLDFNIQLVSPADLLMPANLDSLKYTAYNLIEYLDWDGMLLFAETLEKKLSEINPTSKQEQYNYTILAYWVLRLRLFAYGSLHPNQKADLFKKSLVTMFKMGLDPKTAIFKFLDIFDSPDIITQETADLLADVNSSQEYLGDAKLFGAKNFKPTLSNWFKEYQIVLKPSSGMKLEPGAFHIVKFMDSNQYAKLLNKEDQEVLRAFLDLCNFLINPIVYIDDKPSGNTTPYTNFQKFDLPEEVYEQPSKPAAVPPQIPAPQNRPPVKPMQEVITNKPLPSIRPVNIQEILKKREEEFRPGLKMESTDTQIKADRTDKGQVGQIPNSKLQISNTEQKTIIVPSKQAEIDRKLEDLKKKVNRSN